MGVLEYSFGSIHCSEDQILDLEEKFSRFHNCDHAVFILFLALANHWVALIVHKAPRKQARVYLLDSTNLKHLSRDDVSGVVMDYVRHKIQLGLKVTEKSVVQTTI